MSHVLTETQLGLLATAALLLVLIAPYPVHATCPFSQRTLLARSPPHSPVPEWVRPLRQRPMLANGIALLPRVNPSHSAIFLLALAVFRHAYRSIPDIHYLLHTCCIELCGDSVRGVVWDTPHLLLLLLVEAPAPDLVFFGALEL